MFQRCSFKWNLILLEITQIAKNRSTIEFWILLTNTLLEKHISEMKLYLRNNFQGFFLYPSIKCLLHGSLWFAFTTRTPETNSKQCFAALLSEATTHYLNFYFLHVLFIIFNLGSTVYKFRFRHLWLYVLYLQNILF